VSVTKEPSLELSVSICKINYKKAEQINDHLFLDTYKSNNIQIGVNDMTVNDSEMCEMKRRSLVNTGDISPEIA